MLARVTPIRDFFLDPSNYADCRSPLVQRTGELLRKVWHPRNFKGQVSPHDFMQAVLMESNKRFVIDKPMDPVQFLTWLLNTLHRQAAAKYLEMFANSEKFPKFTPPPQMSEISQVFFCSFFFACCDRSQLTGSKVKRPSVITRALQGEVEVWTEGGTGGAKEFDSETGGMKNTVERVPFFMLALDLPQTPLYKDQFERLIIPQVRKLQPTIFLFLNLNHFFFLFE